MKHWYDWGEKDFGYPLSSHPFFIPFLERTLGRTLPQAGRAEEPRVPIPKPRLTKKVLDAIMSVVGKEGISLEGADRLTHSVGKGYKDLIRARKGCKMPIVDAVLRPKTEEQIERILRISSLSSIEIVPFGGGTSVLGGIEPAGNPSMSVDMVHFKQMVLDPTSNIALLGAGLRGPEVERALNKDGFTLGHFPQSFEFSTVGGWVATRSAGQASTKYGKIEDMVCGLRMVTPRGILEIPVFPASATGPDLKGFCVGSEGILGIITSATLRIRPLPSVSDYRGFFFHNFAQGCEAVRLFMQSGATPAVVRLSDESETEASLALSRKKGISAEYLGRWFLGWRDYRCLLILGTEGTAEEVRFTRSLCSKAIGACGGMGVGRTAALAWMRERFMHPYLRDELLDRGIIVDTLETASTWGKLGGLYRATRDAIGRAIESEGIRGIVMTHLSHAYPTGACLYFTYMTPQSGDELTQWARVKRSATETILGHGGTLSHHHGIGRDHAPWLEAHLSPLGLRAIRRQKSLFDSRGIMNTGKVVTRNE